MSRIAIVLINTINIEKKGSVNYKIAKYLIDNMHNLEKCSMSCISKNCSVANSSISRFARKIGFEDFFDLKDEIVKMNKMNKEKFIVSGDKVLDYKYGYVDDVLSNIQLVRNSLNYDIIDELIKDIHKFDKVAAFGYLHSEYIALGLQNDLYTSKKVIESRISFKEQLDYLENATKDDLIIIFSLSGSYFERFKDISKKLFLENKSKIYIVTGSENVKGSEIVDSIIKFKVDNTYSAHPFALQLVANIISFGYYNYLSKQ